MYRRHQTTKYINELELLIKHIATHHTFLPSSCFETPTHSQVIELKTPEFGHIYESEYRKEYMQ